MPAAEEHEGVRAPPSLPRRTPRGSARIYLLNGVKKCPSFIWRYEYEPPAEPIQFMADYLLNRHESVQVRRYEYELPRPPPRPDARMLRPISLLRLSLLRLLDSKHPGIPMGLGSPPFTVNSTLESNPPKSRTLVRRLAVCAHVRLNKPAWAPSVRVTRK